MWGPVSWAQATIRLGVQLAYWRWLLGMCSGNVVWPPFSRLRPWLATLFPSTKHSTVWAVALNSKGFLTSR